MQQFVLQNDQPVWNTVRDSTWLLFFTTAALILIGLGLRDPWPADEPRYALIAKEMVESGQWFFPARAQELYPDKPPIFLWSIAFFYWLTGSLKIAFLLPSALCGIGTVVLIYDLGKRLWNKQTGLVAGWMLLFSFQFMLQSKSAQIDAMVCAWITIGCYGLLRSCALKEKYRWYLLGWFFMGIGVITKGVGFLPLLMLIPYAVYRVRTKQPPHGVAYSWRAWLLGPVIMLLAIGLWFIPMLIFVATSADPALEMYRDNILFRQTVTRYAESWHHIKPFWYYVVSVIPLFWLPVSLATPWLFKHWLSAWKANDPRVIMPLGWIILVILFFTLSPGKRGVYIFPALPMFVLVVAPFFESLWHSNVLKYGLFAISSVLSVALLLFGVAGVADVPAVVKLSNNIESDIRLFALCTGGLSSLGIALTLRKSKWLAWPVFFTTVWIIYSTYGYQLRNEVSTPHAVFREAKNIIPDNSELALIDLSEQFILFSPYPVVHFGYHTDIHEQTAAAYQWLTHSSQYILVEDKLIDRTCFDVSAGIDVGYAHRRQWVLLPHSAKLEDCSAKTSDAPVFHYKYVD